MLDKRRFVVGALLIAARLYLVWPASARPRRTTTRWTSSCPGGPTHGEDLRVKGWGAPQRRWDARTGALAFELARRDGSDAVPVGYTGILPDMFAEGREVVVEGRWAQGAFTARQIMTSCPSKYEPAIGDAAAVGGAWRAPTAAARG